MKEGWMVGEFQGIALKIAMSFEIISVLSVARRDNYRKAKSLSEAPCLFPLFLSNPQFICG
jgi:hypothetical protein